MSKRRRWTPFGPVLARPLRAVPLLATFTPPVARRHVLPSAACAGHGRLGLQAWRRSSSLQLIFCVALLIFVDAAACRNIRASQAPAAGLLDAARRTLD
jgi:hypothetical protein